MSFCTRHTMNIKSSITQINKYFLQIFKISAGSCSVALWLYLQQCMSALLTTQCVVFLYFTLILFIKKGYLPRTCSRIRTNLSPKKHFLNEKWLPKTNQISTFSHQLIAHVIKNSACSLSLWTFHLSAIYKNGVINLICP